MKPKIYSYYLVSIICLSLSFAVSAENIIQHSIIKTYICPSFPANNNSNSLKTVDIWLPDANQLMSVNKLKSVRVYGGNQNKPDFEFIMRGSSGRTKINDGYWVNNSPVAAMSKKNKEVLTDPDIFQYWADYIVCEYTNTTIVQYTKIAEEMKACDVQYKKINNSKRHLKTIATGNVTCSTDRDYNQSHKK
jgi:hypothetical protein